LIAIWFLSPNGVVSLFSRNDIRDHGGAAFVLTWLGLMVLWSIAADRPRQEWLVALTVLGLGVGLEIVQIFTRTDPSASDVLIDGLGIATAWSSWRWVRPWLDRRRAKSKGEGLMTSNRPQVSVIKKGSQLAWEEVPRPEGDETPPGEAFEAFASTDGRATAGLWRRPIREGEMTRPFDEVSIVIDGIAEVVEPDAATTHRGQPGDTLVTPRGSGGTWRCVTDVRKFWAICETDTENPGSSVVRDDADLVWTEVPRPEGDSAPPGEETVSFHSADGRFVTGLWRRGPEEGPMDLDEYDEIAYILEGDITVTDQETGVAHEVGPGDILVTPLGTHATWRSHSPVKKFWMIYKSQ